MYKILIINIKETLMVDRKTKLINKLSKGFTRLKKIIKNAVIINVH